MGVRWGGGLGGSLGGGGGWEGVWVGWGSERRSFEESFLLADRVGNADHGSALGQGVSAPTPPPPNQGAQEDRHS